MLKMMRSIIAAFGCDFALFARILGTELRRFRLKIARFCHFCGRFGAILAQKHARIDHQRRLIIAGSRCACSGVNLQQNFECAVRCARKIYKIVDVNRTSSRWFLEVLEHAKRMLRARCARGGA